jgi:hypothetical protein
MKSLLVRCIVVFGFLSMVKHTCAITISSDEFEGRPQWRIETASTTYFMDQAAGGFSKMLDRDGKDWIAFKKEPLSKFPDSAAAGYRGIPNLLFGEANPDRGGGHPGFDQCTTKVIGDDLIYCETKSKRWAWSWHFTDQYATLSILRTDHAQAYWVLYEGPTGGSWSSQSHYFGTDEAGPVRNLPDIDHQSFGQWQSVYFGDDNSPRTLLAVQRTKDALRDTLWYMGASQDKLAANDGMVVFGFGREKSSIPLLKDAGLEFRFGFVEGKVVNKADHEKLMQVAYTWQADTSKPIEVTEKTHLGDMECFEIVTPTATYLYGKNGAGFASVYDAHGHDWVSYQHGNKAAGEYRGLPKCGQPTKFFHCGYSFGQYKTDNIFVSQIVSHAADHVRIHSETKDGKSACDWDFYSTHATMTLLKIDQPKYWFLYEGTPGGKLDATQDAVVRPGNQQTTLDTPWAQKVDWVYFTAQESPCSMFMIKHQPHESIDSYVSWPYKPEADGSVNQMTVFGFGRPDWQDPAQHTPPLSDLPARFTIGFTEESSYEQIAPLLESLKAK